MDVRYYFDPVDFSAYYNSGHLNWRYSIGSEIEKNTNTISSGEFKKVKIVIVGVPFDSRNENTHSAETPDKIRAELYRLAKFTSPAGIADLGNLKPASSTKGSYKAIRDIVDYFNELKIVTVVIGGSQDLSVGICEAFQGNRFFSFSTVDAFLDIKTRKGPFNSSNFLTRIFTSQPDIFQFNLIGYQSYYMGAGYFSKTCGIGSHIRLGNLRSDISVAEPVLRNTDFLSFDFIAVKHSDAPGTTSALPNGLRSEEACQLSKYAGLSNRLKVIGLFDLVTENDKNNMTVKLAAQMVWYFLEGVLYRDNLVPGPGPNMTTFKVEVDGVDKPLVFIKDAASNRWWVQIEKAEKDTLCFACSESDYILASKNEIPELWLKYFQKIGDVLK